MRRELALVALSLSLLGAAAGADAALSDPVKLAAADQAPAQPPASVSVPTTDTYAYPPPVTVEAVPGGRTGPAVAKAASYHTSTIPAAVLAAYQWAAAAVPTSCHLTVPLLAAIGQVESGNLVGRQLDAEHRAVPPVLGPMLDGKQYTAMPDTDSGVLDGSTVWDRAVGPMQFIPSTWARFGVDLDGDGIRDPQDIEDAAGAAAAYLCYGDRDLSTEAGLREAVLSYNHSESYLKLVLSWMAQFETGFGTVSYPTVSVTTIRDYPPTGTPTQPTGTHTPGSTTETKGPITVPPSHTPTSGPTGTPTGHPTSTPTATPTSPTSSPTSSPSESPSCEPTDPASESPTATPTPTQDPSPDPCATESPTEPPTGSPTGPPTETPPSSIEPTPQAQPTP